MFQRMLLLQGLVINFVGVFVTRFIVSPFYFAEPEFEGGSPTGVALVTVIEPHDAEKDCTFGEVGTEATPERVPLSGLIGDARHLQYPVPYCQPSGPQTQWEVWNQFYFTFGSIANAPW
jgi:hypothetical protein